MNHPAFQRLPPLSVFQDRATDLALSYRDGGRGPGPALVFLHGYNGSSKSWAFQFARFADSRRVIAIDFPGYGRSTATNLPMADVAGVASRLLQSLDLSPCVLVGHSMGGMLAQVVACEHGDQVAGVVLSCTHTGYGPDDRSELAPHYALRMEERQVMDDRAFGAHRVEKMVPNLQDRPILQFLEAISGDITFGGIRSGGLAMQRLDTAPMLDRLTQPCLILSAELDRVAAPERVKDLCDRLPAARHIQLAGVGHAPYAEDAEAFNRAVDQFVASLPMAGSRFRGSTG